MAHQLQTTRPVQLGEPGHRAFVARMPNASGPGHLGIFVREEGTQMKDKPKKEKIREFFGSGVPVMVGGKRVYGSLSNEIENQLKYALRRHAERVLKSMEG